MQPEELNNFGKGAIYDKLDDRDYQYEQLFGAVQLPNEYNVFDEVGTPKVENQGSSSSCTSQAWSKYMEVLNYFDEKKSVDLSAKFIYSRIFQPAGGASIRDGAALAVSTGTCKENLDPSYESGNPPTEAYMRQINASPIDIADAVHYEAKSYATIASKDVEVIKQAIYQNKGVVSGFVGDNAGWVASDGIVRPPANNDWAHCVFLAGWKKIGGKDYIILLNSWSERWGVGGFGYVHPDYWTNPSWSFNIWTLIDKPNNNFMYTLQRDPLAKTEVFAVIGTTKRHIGNYYTLSQGKGVEWDYTDVASIPFADPTAFAGLTEGAEIIFTPHD
ncbi:MAG: C1 family peptidase [Thaumarchaeota archaeon]|nr:C1 family peptidase [Nitrososphaerota archaeon]